MSNTKQHYVPRFYLRQWSDADEKLWMYGVNGAAPVHISIDNVAFERGLYSHPSVDEMPPLTTEKSWVKELKMFMRVFGLKWLIVLETYELEGMSLDSSR